MLSTMIGWIYMLQIKNLTIAHLKDNRILLDKFNLIINPGDKAAIIGEEGNGKSTLLKLIYNAKSCCHFQLFMTAAFTSFTLIPLLSVPLHLLAS